MKKIILLLLVITLSSCMKVAFLIFGVHKPKPLSLDKMKKKYETSGYLEYPVFVFKDASSYYEFVVKYPDVNGVYIFNKEGMLVTPINEMTCSADNRSYLSSFSNPETMRVDSLFNISMLENNTTIIQKNSFGTMRDTSKNFNIVLCFADFVGRVNKQTTSVYVDQLKEADSSEFSLSLLSLDPLKK
ncbi:MAG: hypothetical protein ACJAR8_000134 [Bacteroidia bacterium]|jgi:hypothetical protein